MTNHPVFEKGCQLLEAYREACVKVIEAQNAQEAILEAYRQHAARYYNESALREIRKEVLQAHK